jgi:hypothetical protein
MDYNERYFALFSTTKCCVAARMTILFTGKGFASAHLPRVLLVEGGAA